MSTPRQIKVYIGSPPSGGFADDPIVDTLGNSWIGGDSYEGGASGTGSSAVGASTWYMPSTVNTVGGAVSFRGVSFDRDVLPNALLVAVALKVNTTETHLILFEFGAKTATVAYDYGSGGSHHDVSEITSGKVADTPTPIVGDSLSVQTWVVVTSTTRSATVTDPAEYTEVIDTGFHRVYYRVANTPLTVDPAGAYTYSPAAHYHSLAMRFAAVTLTSDPPAPVPLPIPTPTAAAPQTPCDPQAQKSGGGTGNSGCNDGGIGKDRITFPAYGTAPAHADPEPGETLSSTATAVDLWIELHHRTPDGTVQTYARSLVELADDPDYHYGRKPSGLMTLGDMEHGLGNEQGSFEAADCDLHLSEAIERWLRTILDGDEIEGDEVEVFAASRAARDAGTRPKPLMRGVVSRPQTESSLQAILTAVDVLFSVRGPFGKPWPFWTIGDVYDMAPDDVKAISLPYLYGPKSDAGAKKKQTNEPLEKGLVPWHYLRPVTIGAAPSSTAGLPTETDDAIGLVDGMGNLGLSGSGWISDGTVNGDPYKYVQRVKGGKMGPAAGGRSPSAAPADTAYSFLTVFNDRTDQADAWLVTMVPASVGADWRPGDPVPDGADIRYQIIYAPNNPFPDWQFGVAWLDPTTGSPWTGGGAAAGSNEWGECLVLAHACYQGGAVFGSDGGSGDPNARPDRVKLDEARNGVDYLWPWNHDGSIADAWVAAFGTSQTWFDETGSDGKTYRVTKGYLRGTLLDDHLAGKVNVTCNMRAGIEHVGDGTGLPIVAAHHAQQHWIENFLLNRWRSGLWVTNLTAPAWPDGTPKVCSRKFAARQAMTAAALGDIGLRVSWYPQRKDVIAHVLDWNKSTGTDLGVNNEWQISLGYIDETVDHTTLPRVDHVTDIFGKVSTQYNVRRCNVRTVSCDWDPDKQQYRIGPITLKNAAAVSRYNKGPDGEGLEVAETFESPILDDEQQLRWVTERDLALFGSGVTVTTVPGRMRLLDHDVDGDGILLTTLEGPGASGYVDRPVQIRREGFRLAGQLATLTVWDAAPFLISTRFTNGLQRVPTITNTSGGMRVTNDPDLAPLVLR